MDHIDKALGSIPFVIKGLEPNEQEKILYYAGNDRVENWIETINGVEYKFYGRRSTEQGNMRKEQNVGTVGHTGISITRGDGRIGWTPPTGEFDYNGGPSVRGSLWGPRGYQPDLSLFASNAPTFIFRSPHPLSLEYRRIVGLWSQYIREVQEGRPANAALRPIFDSRNKLGTPYLGFQNGGLIVADRVIWILPHPEYAGYHKKAAEWVLPSKEYVKGVVDAFLANPIIAHVQGADIRKNDVSNGWGAFKGKKLIPEYTRNADGSYLVDTEGKKIPTGRMVEGIEINIDALRPLDQPK